MPESPRRSALLTVTPNPSLDLLFSADSLHWDDANRVDEPRRRPGGQGINAARVANILGASVTAVALLGGRTGREIEAALAAEGMRVRAVQADAETRLFIAVHVGRRKRSLLINSRGHARTGEDADRLLDACIAAIQEERPEWVAGCGSLPPGFPKDFYARLGHAAHSAGARFVADCDGETLAHAINECDLLVPNHHEAGRLLGWRVGHAAAAVRAAPELLQHGATAAAITLGSRGAVLACGPQAWRARAPRQAGLAVGAGDAFLAALLVGFVNGEPPEAALRSGTAAGAAVLLSAGDSILDSRDYAALLAETRVRTAI